jgi:hypothetical protein
MIFDDWWLAGLCSTFAAGLKARFGGELWAIVNHSRKWEDDELWHCYCVINGTAYDAAGPHPLTEASDTTRWTVPPMDRENDVVMEWRRVDERWLGNVHQDYNPDDFPAVNAYIDRNRHLFPR